MAKKFLILLTITVLIFGLAGCRTRGGGGSASKRVELTYYKLFDAEDTIKPIIQAYEKAHPNVKIKYKKFTEVEEYEELLINELAEGEGPDIFEVQNTWVPRHMKKITPLASETFTPQIFEETFVTVAAKDFLQVDPKDGVVKVYALPLSVDTLALYYNKAHFDRYVTETGKPALSWDGIKESVFQLRDDEGGALVRSGIAMGRSDNIALAEDILYALFLQYGVNFYDSTYKNVRFATGEGQDALKLFTSFADPKQKHYSWNSSLVNEDSMLKEVEAFLTGKTSMIIGYASLYEDFEVMSKNVKSAGQDVISLADIEVAPLPQKAEAEEQFKTYASYFGQTVSRTSKNPSQAWDFIQFLTTKEQAQKYLDAAKRPTARRDLIEGQKRDPVLGVFVQQLGYAESIPVYHDRKFKDFFVDAITAVVDDDMTPSEALSEAQQLINAILPEGGIYPPPPGIK
ncbi:MAG: MalE-type ABC sugar transport system periplasmic component [Candidatus Peregrinibacteria bacterium GW2011_GWA2_47_7]|nr:MAG: MalE-type ABC sugar transport system periplasmic component [Candidatus Peregrinibacteria bacterium GW2011_GWA2_47_7]